MNTVSVLIFAGDKFSLYSRRNHRPRNFDSAKIFAKIFQVASLSAAIQSFSRCRWLQCSVDMVASYTAFSLEGHFDTAASSIECALNRILAFDLHREIKIPRKFYRISRKFSSAKISTYTVFYLCSCASSILNRAHHHCYAIFTLSYSESVASLGYVIKL